MPQPGDILFLAFSFFPGSMEIQVSGRVVRAINDEVAVRFIDLGGTENRLLGQALPSAAFGTFED